MSENKIFIFGHRGASGTYNENTIKSFKAAAQVGAGIETDVRLTKDDVLVCFHDPGFKLHSKWYVVKNLNWSQLKAMEFKDSRNIPTINDLFELCTSQFPEIKLSIDIGNTKAGIRLIDMANNYNFLSQIIITDMFPKRLRRLRKYNDSVELVHTMDIRLTKINSQNTNFSELKKLGIQTINIKSNRFIELNFKQVVEHQFDCFVWGINSMIRMKKILKLNHKNKKIKAIYTDYPKKMINLLEKQQ
ncbi:MAG: hypothetical protein BAJALOKI2v1_50082 [Promethearchaeota archaeon]|nr:MAG: hypothetical protein BAJALOKI2v1_50082 [Candidatus Lokiarchaeota archaeon]